MCLTWNHFSSVPLLDPCEYVIQKYSGLTYWNYIQGFGVQRLEQIKFKACCHKIILMGLQQLTFLLQSYTRFPHRTQEDEPPAAASPVVAIAASAADSPASGAGGEDTAEAEAVEEHHSNSGGEGASMNDAESVHDDLNGGDDSNSELNAPTLQLGEQSSQDDISESCRAEADDDGDASIAGSKSVVGDSPSKSPRDASDSIEESESDCSEGQPDSQVSSGWMGKVYNYEARREKREKAKATIQQCMQDLESDLRNDDDVDGSLLPDYLLYCQRSLAIHGVTCYTTLANTRHYLEWVGKQKAQDNRAQMFSTIHGIVL